jgi:hypothetical protein
MEERHMKLSVESMQHVLTLAQTITVLAAALVGAIKFKVFQIWKHTFRTDMQCRHSAISNGETIFVAEYTIQNTGDRPLSIDRVQLQLCPALQVHGGHLMPDRSKNILMPTLFAAQGQDAGTDKHVKPLGGLGEIKKDERSTFTLRCCLRELPDVFFVFGEFNWTKSWFRPDREPSFYSFLYIKSQASGAARKAPQAQAARA